jgi:hypothetical protein
VDGDPVKGASIAVSNRGQLVLPATMRIILNDGTTSNVIIPAETWIQSSHHIFAVYGHQPIASVIIDQIDAFRNATAPAPLGPLRNLKIYLCD